MSLTATQKLQAKKHVGVWPNDDILDTSIAALEDGGAKELELTTAIALCETRLAAINTAAVASDELVKGGGAEFSYERYISVRKQHYRDAVDDLARLLSVDMTNTSGSVATGWRIC